MEIRFEMFCFHHVLFRCINRCLFSSMIFKQQMLCVVIESWHRWSKARKGAGLKPGRFSSQLALSCSYDEGLFLLLAMEMFVAAFCIHSEQHHSVKANALLVDRVILIFLGESAEELSPAAGLASPGSSVHWATLQACYMLLVLFILADWWSTMF